MRIKYQIACPVHDLLDVAAARRNARRCAQEAGFTAADANSVAIAISELGHNLVFHATRGGVLTISLIQRGLRIGLEIISEDDGPGIADAGLALTDNYSTRGGLGCGLAAVRRLTDEFKISTRLGSGTYIAARKWRLCP